jgi:hypothetical protein
MLISLASKAVKHNKKGKSNIKKLKDAKEHSSNLSTHMILNHSSHSKSKPQNIFTSSSSS